MLCLRKSDDMKNKLFERSFRIILNDYLSDLMNYSKKLMTYATSVEVFKHN